MIIHARLRSAPAIKVRFSPGATGPSGTVTVNPTTITGAPGSDASVANTGTPTAAVLQFTIPRGNTGATGDDGWSPILAVVTDGTRRVLQLTDWTGGEGTKPAAGSYIGPTGLVAAIGDAVDIRGDTGPAGTVTDGDKGDIVVSSSGTAWAIDPAVLSTFGRTLIDDADAEAARTTLGVSAANTPSTATGSVAATNVQAAIAELDTEKAPLASPALTGTPTAPTASAGTNTTQLATTAFVKEESDLLKSKQAWVKIYDQTVSGSPVNGFVVPLQGFTRFRITGVFLPNPSAADFFVFWRGSTDGVNFDSGASDYAYTALFNENAVITSTSTNAASYGQMTGLATTAASGTALLVQALFTNGVGGGNARMDCDSGGRSSTYEWLMRIGSERLTGTVYTHITIAASQVGAMAVGSKIIVEAC